jgi:two-component system, chemotaxis family, chemotaxis protein CheY
MPIKKILIVEDSDLLHRMYEVVFRDHRYNKGALLHAYHGREALMVLSQHADVDLIILDINMPVMSGLEFLHHCATERVFQHIPVIIVSTEGKEEDTIRALRAGARGYVTKPFQPRELHVLIDRIAAERPVKAVTAELAGSAT